MATMSPARWRSFLTERPRTAKLSTVRADGRPHVAPVWFDIDEDGSIVVMTGEGTVKGRAIRRDRRVGLCVDDEAPPFAFVTMDATATIVDDPDELLRWSIRIAGRYMGSDRAEEYGRRNAVPSELLVRLTPTHVVAEEGVAD